MCILIYVGTYSRYQNILKHKKYILAFVSNNILAYFETHLTYFNIIFHAIYVWYLLKLIECNWTCYNMFYVYFGTQWSIPVISDGLT